MSYRSEEVETQLQEKDRIIAKLKAKKERKPMPLRHKIVLALAISLITVAPAATTMMYIGDGQNTLSSMGAGGLVLVAAAILSAAAYDISES